MITNKEEIIIKNENEMEIISIRYTGKYSECGKYIGKLYSIAKGNAKGSCFNRYFDKEYKEENADIEVSIGVKKKVTHPDVISQKLNAVKVVSTVHVGSYDTLGLAYKRIRDYLLEQGLTPVEPPREFYIKGPGFFFKGNPNKYVTEIQFPVAIL